MTFGKFCMKISYVLRGNPMRFLYTDALLGRFSDSRELEYFGRKWGNVIWDVGASVGKYTVKLAESNPDATIIAFEPNLNSLYYLAYRTARYPNVVIVPCAMTAEGQPMKGTYSPDFGADPTGPLVDTISVDEAVRKFGMPSFVKMDIEGGEYSLLDVESSPLFESTMLVAWHPGKEKRPMPKLAPWNVEQVTSDMTLLTPSGS